MLYQQSLTASFTNRFTSDLSPVKCDRNERDPRPSSKYLIDHHILWLDPCDKCEDTQELCHCQEYQLSNYIPQLRGNLKGQRFLATTYYNPETNTRQNFRRKHKRSIDTVRYSTHYSLSDQFCCGHVAHKEMMY
jgi:hypothetical protein